MSHKRQTVVRHFHVVGRAIQAIVRDEDAVTAIEYALLAALIGVFAAASIATLGDRVEAMWTVVSDAVVGAM